jgi:hypothetical protein
MPQYAVKGRAWRLMVVAAAALSAGCGGSADSRATKDGPASTVATSTTPAPKTTAPPPPNEASAAKSYVRPPPARLNDLVGDWDWGWGVGIEKPRIRSIVTFRADGTIVQPGLRKHGTWELAGDELKVDWNDKTWTRMTLAVDGLSMQGRNNFGMRTIARKRAK